MPYESPLWSAWQRRRDLLRTEDRARFAALDSGGVLYAGELPSRRIRFLDVARRHDDSVLTAFLDYPDPDLGDGASEEVRTARVFLDGQPILVRDTVRDLTLTPDGSSYFFVERLPNETSQLVIHNLDLGFAQTWFPGKMYDPPAGSHRPYWSRYSEGPSEIIFELSRGYEGDHLFLPADGSRRGWRRIDVCDFPFGTRIHLPSSETGYYELKNITADPTPDLSVNYFDRWGCERTATEVLGLKEVEGRLVYAAGG